MKCSFAQHNTLFSVKLGVVCGKVYTEPCNKSAFCPKRDRENGKWQRVDCSVWRLSQRENEVLALSALVVFLLVCWLVGLLYRPVNSVLIHCPRVNEKEDKMRWDARDHYHPVRYFYKFYVLKWLNDWRGLLRFLFTGDCGNACGYEEPYGWVPEACCPIHDPETLFQIIINPLVRLRKANLYYYQWTGWIVYLYKDRSEAVNFLSLLKEKKGKK